MEKKQREVQKRERETWVLFGLMDFDVNVLWFSSAWTPPPLYGEIVRVFCDDLRGPSLAHDFGQSHQNLVLVLISSGRDKHFDLASI